jgi:hypothetical protein
VVSARKSALVLALVVIGWWGVEMIQCYPDYHLNGYQWLGKRVLFGRSSIGYRSIVFTPADGVQQVMKWLNENAKHDEVAQLCGFPWHIVRYAAPGPVYQLTNGLETTLAMEPNYVVLHVNDLLWQEQGTARPWARLSANPLDQEVLEHDYQQVFVVERAFGLEIASVWKRR